MMRYHVTIKVVNLTLTTTTFDKVNVVTLTTTSYIFYIS